jgi:hypothetical protein
MSGSTFVLQQTSAAGSHDIRLASRCTLTLDGRKLVEQVSGAVQAMKLPAAHSSFPHVCCITFA